MSPGIAAIRSALITHRQLTRAGLSNKAISAQHSRGELIRLTRGIYLRGELAQQCDARERAIAVTIALALSRSTTVISHQSAALLWGAPLIGLPAKVHLSLRGADHAGHKQAVLHGTRPEIYKYTTELHGVKVTNPLTTIIDCVKTMPVNESLAITDYFLAHKHLPQEQVRLALEQVAGRGSRKAGTVALLMSPLSESPLESYACLRLYEGDLEAPLQQYEVVTPSGRLYRADFAWPSRSVILEVDGLHKYFGAYRPPEDQLRNDALRQRELELAGWTIIRATWGDLAERPDIVIARLRRLGVGSRKT